MGHGHQPSIATFVWRTGVPSARWEAAGHPWARPPPGTTAAAAGLRRPRPCCLRLHRLLPRQPRGATLLQARPLPGPHGRQSTCWSGRGSAAAAGSWQRWASNPDGRWRQAREAAHTLASKQGVSRAALVQTGPCRVLA